MTDIIGDPQGTQARAIATEVKHPVGSPEEPPSSYRWMQLIGLLALIGIPVLLWLLSRLL